MSASPPSGLFRPAQQGHNLATLVLIENSAAMVERWPDLRDHYLPTLLGTVRKVNPVVPIQVLWMTSSPVSPSEEAIPSPHNSRPNHLPEVRFSPQPNNKISISTLFRATDLLASTFRETSTTRHLFVIAASGPSETMDVPSLIGADPQTVCQTLGAKLTKGNIHLHMILNPKVQESEHFSQLFYDVLGMQQLQEAGTWFSVNENYHFHLSMCPQGHQDDTSRPFPSVTQHRTPVGYAGTASAVSPSLMSPTSGISGMSLASPITAAFPDVHPPPPSLLTQVPQRIPLPRNNSFPPAGVNGRPAPRSSATSSTNNSPPPSIANIPSGSDAEPKLSLVKHLQKVHGLTKKRNYGFQTSRTPFIRDESTSSSPYSPTTSIDPANGRPRRNTGVNANKGKKGDDPRRPRRGSVHVGLPESIRVSSPESDSSSAPSPTATVAGVLASPTGPVTVGLQMGMPVASAPLNLAEVSYGAVPPPPLWQSEALGPAAAPANAAPTFTDIPPAQQLQPPPPTHGLAPPQVQTQAQVQQAHVPVTAPLASSNYSNAPHGNDPPVAYATTTTTTSTVAPSSFVLQPSAALHSTPPAVAPAPVAPALSQAPGSDDGDKPFIFYPEYEDAVVPQPPLFPSLSAAAQPTQMAQYWMTASADYSHILNPAVAPGLLRATHPPVYEAVSTYDPLTHPQPAHAHLSSHVQPGVVYAGEQSSSLQSWAGY